MFIKGIIYHLPNAEKIRKCANGTIIEYAKDGHRIYTFGTDSKPYKAGFNQLEVIKVKAQNFLSICMIRDGDNIMQASRMYSKANNTIIYSNRKGNPFKIIADLIRERKSK